MFNRSNQDTEEENLLVDPQGEVVECVFVEPVKEPEPVPVVVKKVGIRGLMNHGDQVIGLSE